MSAVLNIVLPVFGVILAGVLSRRFGLLGEDSAEALNKFVFYIALPPMLFLSCARVPIAEVINLPFIGTFILATLATIEISVVVGWLFFRHRSLSVMTLFGMATIFSNTVYLGIPLLILAYGPKGAAPAIIVTLLSNVMFLTLSAVLIESSQLASRRDGKWYSVLLSSLRNPLIVSPVLGAMFSWSGLSLPLPAENLLDLLARGAGSTALFALGMSLYGFNVTAGAREIGAISLLKLLIYPLITWWVGRYVFDLQDFWLDTAVILAALPTGALLFVVAQRYSVYVQRSAATVVVTTAISVVTLAVVFVWASP